jgi:hypothetical protein
VLSATARLRILLPSPATSRYGQRTERKETMTAQHLTNWQIVLAKLAAKGKLA